MIGRRFAFYYYVLSLAGLLCLESLARAFGDSNLPPVDPALRFWINLLLFNSLAAFAWLILDGGVLDHLSGWYWGVLAVVAACFAFTGPVFSGDIFEYLIRGRILAIHGASPYAHVPAEFPGDLLFSKSIWKTFPLDYGPLAGYLLCIPALVAKSSISGMIFVYKVMQVLFIAALTLVFIKLTQCLDSKHYQKLAALLCLNPYWIVMMLIDGHNDLAMMFFCIAAVYCLEKKRYGACFLFWTASFLIKYSVILMLPFLALRYIKERYAEKGGIPWNECILYAASNALVVTAFYAPLWAGWEKHLVLWNYSKWFYSNSIPYAFWKGLSELRFVIPEIWVGNAFFYLFVTLYLFVFIYYALKPRPTQSLFYRSLTAVYAGFCIQITAPFHSWYLLWLMPWLILCKWPRLQWQVLLISSIGLFSYCKRINYLIVGGTLMYITFIFFYGLIRKKRGSAGNGLEACGGGS